jgi:hypothetical protein
MLLAASTFWWSDGEYGTRGGAILALAMVLWIPGFVALFGLLRNRLPRYANWGLLPAWYGCVSGSLFAFQGIYSEVFGIDRTMERAAYAEHALIFDLTLFWPGPLFPASLLVLGVCLLVKRATPAWAAVLLALAGVAFPLGRIPRVEGLAHLADALLLVPALYLGWRVFRSADDGVERDA